LGLAALTVTLSVAVPALEQGDFVVASGIESQHDPDRCGHKHDHRICAQVGGNLSQVADAHDYRLPHVTLRLKRETERRSELRRGFLEGPPSRAPPLV
jgi:hypothetical protein